MPKIPEMQQMPSQASSTDRGTTSIAVDLGGTKISAARISNYTIVERRKIDTDQNAAPETHMETIVGLIQALREERNHRLGVAVCGRVDHHGNWHALNNNTLKGFSSFPLRAELEARLGQPINVMNDATAAAWAEYSLCSADEDIDSLFYVTVSTGVGGGIVLNSRPVTSTDGMATHFGFVRSLFGSEICGSGRFGTLESVASGAAISRAGSSGRDEGRTGYDVYQAHLSGDRIATAAIDRSAKAIATAIADVRALLGVQLVTIGGSVGLAEGYIALVQQYLDEEPELFRPRVIAAKLGTDSALYGVVA